MCTPLAPRVQPTHTRMQTHVQHYSTCYLFTFSSAMRLQDFLCCRHCRAAQPTLQYQAPYPALDLLIMTQRAAILQWTIQYTCTPCSIAAQGANVAVKFVFVYFIPEHQLILSTQTHSPLIGCLLKAIITKCSLHSRKVKTISSYCSLQCHSVGHRKSEGPKAKSNVCGSCFSWSWYFGWRQVLRTPSVCPPVTDQSQRAPSLCPATTPSS
jgi:hypothetical protein